MKSPSYIIILGLNFSVQIVWFLQCILLQKLRRAIYLPLSGGAPRALPRRANRFRPSYRKAVQPRRFASDACVRTRPQAPRQRCSSTPRRASAVGRVREPEPEPRISTRTMRFRWSREVELRRHRRRSRTRLRPSPRPAKRSKIRGMSTKIKNDTNR